MNASSYASVTSQYRQCPKRRFGRVEQQKMMLLRSVISEKLPGISSHIGYFPAPKSLPNGGIRGQFLRMISLVLHARTRVRRERGTRDL